MLRPEQFAITLKNNDKHYSERLMRFNKENLSFYAPVGTKLDQFFKGYLSKIVYFPSQYIIHCRTYTCFRLF